MKTDEPSTKIKESTIETLRVPCADFMSNPFYAQVLSSHPSFSYMGIKRESSPKDVISKIGLPNKIEHNGVNMYFHYYSSDRSISREKTGVEISWLTMADVPEIMSDIVIRRSDGFWIFL